MEEKIITEVTNEIIENEVADKVTDNVVNTGISHSGSFGGVGAGIGIGALSVAVGYGIYKLAGKLRTKWAKRKDDIIDVECTEIEDEEIIDPEEE